MAHDAILELADANFIESLRRHADWNGGQALTRGASLVTIGGVPFAPGPYNALARGGADAPNELLDFAQITFAAAGRRFSTYVREHADADLEAECRERRYLPSGSSTIMALFERPEASRAAGATVKRVIELADVERFVELAAAGFSTLGLPRPLVAAVFEQRERLLSPELRIVLAGSGGRLGASGLSLRTGNVVGIYWLSTRPEARGVGLASLCTAELARLAFDEGVEAVVLQALPAARGLYRRLGFEALSELRCYCAPRRLLQAA